METSSKNTRGEKMEHIFRDEKTRQRSKDSHLPHGTAKASVKPIQQADVRCELCVRRHQTQRCTSFSSTEKRRQRAQRLWPCFTCLGPKPALTLTRPAAFSTVTAATMRRSVLLLASHRLLGHKTHHRPPKSLTRQAGSDFCDFPTIDRTPKSTFWTSNRRELN
ncbi:hypothetical protein AAVH_14667 [Aphelenchoides avenae]|nr:hypothetical protein AAVH_14667 [Aphelenchus avenae]